MQCFFCPNPAASPVTGCQYTVSAVACAECTRRFWTWFRQHQYRGVNAARAAGCPTFYDSINAPPRRVTVFSEE